MSEALQTRQVRPLNNVVAPIWLYDSSDYPDEIKVPMEDGSVETYVRRIQQPHPNCLKAAEICRNFSNSLADYYSPRHMKKEV